MILELVDQRPQPAELPVPLATLAELVEPLGRAEWVLNLVLVDDPVMADLNARWYGGEGVTDVLSFTYLEAEGSDAPHLAAGEGEAAGDLWVAPGDASPAVTAGEVILAPDYVADRCAQEGWDLRSEWSLLVVHGALHVLGWEHGTPGARAAMQRREAAVLDRLGVAHPLLDDRSED
jgi:probable rRNA maturation factor